MILAPVEAVRNSKSAAVEPNKPFFIRTLKKFQHYADRWWYLPLMCWLIFLDLFLLVFPSEWILVKTVLLRPSRWLITTFALIMSSAVGAVCLAALTQQLGPSFLIHIFGEPLLHSSTWLKIHDTIDRHGMLGLFLMAIGPLPQQPAVALCGLAKMNPLKVFLGVFLGRLPKYFLFGSLARYSPGFFKKHFVRLTS